MDKRKSKRFREYDKSPARSQSDETSDLTSGEVVEELTIKIKRKYHHKSKRKRAPTTTTEKTRKKKKQRDENENDSDRKDEFKNDDNTETDSEDNKKMHSDTRITEPNSFGNKTDDETTNEETEESDKDNDPDKSVRKNDTDESTSTSDDEDNQGDSTGNSTTQEDTGNYDPGHDNDPSSDDSGETSRYDGETMLYHSYGTTQESTRVYALSDKYYAMGSDSTHSIPEVDEMAAMKQELSTTSFEDILKVKEKIGIKSYNKAMKAARNPEKKDQRHYKRENKNRPMEITSKKPSSFQNQQTKKTQISRDPRFDDLSGNFSESHFNKNYLFIEDVKARDKQLLVKKARKEKDEEKRHEILQLVNKMNQKEKVVKMKKIQSQKEKQFREKEVEQAKQGKTPYFLKKSDKKKLELAEKFKELKSAGKLDNYLAKKRKKNAAKDKRALPKKQF